MKRVFLLLLLPFCIGLMGMESCFPGDGTDVDDSGNDAFGTPDHGPPLSYTDNGDGTFKDNVTQFVWEKKLAANDVGGNCADATQANRSVHCVNNTYTWSATGSNSDGTLFTVFLADLNNNVFAGFSDWCIPNVKRLQSIVDYSTCNGCNGGTAASSVPGSTAASIYWSSTTIAFNTSTRGSSASAMASCSPTVRTSAAAPVQYGHARDWSFDHLTI